MRSPSAHYKEPDSMLLKKSWSSHEGTQLSARWSGIPFLQGSQSQAKVTSRQQSWCSNLSFTIGNPCMISLCYCQNLWKHPGVFLMCMLAEIRCSACNSEIVVCLWYWRDNCNYWVACHSTYTNWGKLQHGDPIDLCVTIGDFHILKCYPMGQQNKHFLFRQFCTIHVFRSQTLAQLVMLYL